MKIYNINSIFLDTFATDKYFIDKFDVYNNLYIKCLNELSSKKEKNIAHYLNLDKYFIKLAIDNQDKINSVKYIFWFESHKNETYTENNKCLIVTIIQELLKEIQKANGRPLKSLLCIILLEIINTKLGFGLTSNNTHFNIVVRNKIKELRKTENAPQFVEYLSKFEDGKKYMLITENQKHRKRLVKLYLIGIGTFHALYKKHKQKHNSILYYMTIIHLFFILPIILFGIIFFY